MNGVLVEEQGSQYVYSRVGKKESRGNDVIEETVTKYVGPCRLMYKFYFPLGKCVPWSLWRRVT